MLVIGHRGAAGLARENTLEALRAGAEAGADILEFDVRLTRDGILVLAHDFHNLRTHRDLSFVSRLTLKELQKKAAPLTIAILEEVLDEFFGKIMLNVELKGSGSGQALIRLLKKQYINREKDWNKILISSFRASELVAVRKASDQANLALLQTINPFAFIALSKRIRLSAVGFHRLYTNKLAFAIAKKMQLFTYAYTVNRPEAAALLAARGLGGVVTNYPDRILRELQKQAS